MTIDRRSLIDMLKKGKVDKDFRDHLNNSKAEDDTSVKSAVQQTLSDTNTLIQGTSVEDGIEFALWNDIWNDYGVFGAKKSQLRNHFSGKNHSRGRILNIDFGINIGKEFSYAHMGVVLADFKGIVVVVPVTSYRNRIPKDYENAVVLARANEYPQFDHDSLLLIHQIRAFDKNRIITDTRQSIARTPLMEEVERKFLEIFAPYLNKLSQDRDQELALLREDNVRLQKQIEELTLGYIQAASTEEKL